jgi:hypothetical protein
MGDTHSMFGSRAVLLALLGAVLAACGVGDASLQSPVATQTTASDAPLPTATTTAHAPSPTVLETAVPPSGTPSDGEIEYLLNGLRDDIALNDCTDAPERLPARAVVGIECKISSPTAAKVGVYLFRDSNSLVATYLDRLAQYGAVTSGVQPAADSGCAEGAASDRSYQSSATGGLPGRVGCFLNEQRYANIRVIWPESLVYVGVLGNNDDIAGLFEWSWQGRSPSGPGLAVWEPPDANPLANLYATFRPEGLETQNGRTAFAAGEEIAFDYQLVNRGSTELVVPLIDFYGDLFYLAGSEQTWVERLGNDTSIPCMTSSAVDEQGRYAVSGQILAFPGPPGPRVAPGDSLDRETVLSDTSCFATDKYRFFVEYRRLAEDGAMEPGVFGGPVLGGVGFDFEIGDP